MIRRLALQLCVAVLVVMCLGYTGCTGGINLSGQQRDPPILIPTSLVTVYAPTSSLFKGLPQRCGPELNDEVINDLEVLASIWNRIRAQSAYPKLAENHLRQGRVQLCVAISQTGTLDDVGLFTSSGDTYLDEEALRTTRSVGAVALQRPLSQSHVAMQVALNYSLNKVSFDQELLADRLWEVLATKATYPSQAVASGLQGKVVLYVTLQPNGHAGLIEIHEGSGSDVLDEAAKELVDQAIPFRNLLPFPARPSTFMIPILYSISPLP